MHIDPWSLLQFFHILLFVYWLGADLGVFLCGTRIVRDDLSLDERLRVREIAIALDMAPRTALPLMIPVGFTLAVRYGSPITGKSLIALWAVTLLWVALVWMVHLVKDRALGAAVTRIDYAIRYALILVLGGFSIYCLLLGAPIGEAWLSAKILLFAFIILNGIWLRRISKNWQPAFDRVRAGGADRAVGERMIKDNRAIIKVAAISIWILIGLTGFLGVVKPF
jgi:hypothetical protein